MLSELVTVTFCLKCMKSELVTVTILLTTCTYVKRVGNRDYSAYYACEVLKLKNSKCPPFLNLSIYMKNCC